MHLTPRSRKIGLLLAIFFLFLVFAEDFHHHDDGESHDDCQLCFAAAHFAGTVDFNYGSIDFYCHSQNLQLIEEKLFYSSSQKNPSDSRAPPVAI
jgi:hypothetical protein